MADGKGVGKAGRACGEASVRVFYLFYLRFVQLPHHLVRWAPSNRWWAGYNGAGMSGRGFPLLLLFIALSHSNMMFTSLCLLSFLSGQSRYCRNLLCPPHQQYFGYEKKHYAFQARCRNEVFMYYRTVTVKGHSPAFLDRFSGFTPLTPAVPGFA